jgi:bifunctional enzyme CysN/CysC
MNFAGLDEVIRPELAAAPAPAKQKGALLKLLTCGSVDDGKSTLIGRLLWDAAGVTEDQRAAVTLASMNRAVNGEKIDFSLLLDGLQAEREQGITIDIAWRYFETEDRRFVIIDSPGHEQYTRNMATGASHADVAILLVDARHGVKRQTRRHAAICNLSASSAWCSRSIRWTKSPGRKRATGRSRPSFRAMAESFAFSRHHSVAAAEPAMSPTARR